MFFTESIQINPIDQGNFYWEKLRKGDKDGLEGVYRLYAKELFRYGMAIKSSRAMVKDCIQDIFINLWRYRDTLSATDNVRLYLLKSLSNRIQREILKEKKLVFGREDADFESVFLEESIEERIIASQRDEELTTKLKTCLESLPMRQREVIQLLFFEKMSYEDTSKILGITVDSSYTLVWKAINRLKKGVMSFTVLLLQVSEQLEAIF